MPTHDRFILFDVLGTDVIHPARDLMDAYGQSIIVPAVANAEKELSIFNEWVKTGDADVPPLEWRIDGGDRAAKAQAQAQARASEPGCPT